MATEVVHVIGSTGDYSTISAWEAEQLRDLTIADEIAVAELQAETFVEDVQINGWKVDATRFIHIRAAAGAEYDHVTGSGAWVYFNSNFPADFYHDVTLTGIRHGTPTHERIAYLRSGAATHSNRCFITSKKLHTINNGCTITASIVQQPAGFNDVLLQYFTLQNVTVIADNTYGQIARDSVCQNVLIYNAQSSPTYDNFFNCSGDYNAGSMSAAPGANSVQNITSAEFADYAGGDFHLASDSQLIGAGTDLSSVFTTDIDGDTITTWMIGADYYAAGGGAGYTDSIGIGGIGAITLSDTFIANYSESISVSGVVSVALTDSYVSGYTDSISVSGVGSVTLADALTANHTGIITISGVGTVATVETYTANHTGLASVAAVGSVTLTGAFTAAHIDTISVSSVGSVAAFSSYAAGGAYFEQAAIRAHASVAVADSYQGATAYGDSIAVTAFGAVDVVDRLGWSDAARVVAAGSIDVLDSYHALPYYSAAARASAIARMTLTGTFFSPIDTSAALTFNVLTLRIPHAERLRLPPGDALKIR